MNDKELSVHARKLFLAQSKAAQERNPQKCQCMHQERVKVETATLGVKNIELARHGTVHLADCKHSDMARTCWSEEKPKTKKRTRVVVESR